MAKQTPNKILEYLAILKMMVTLTAIKVVLFFSPQGFRRLLKGSPTILYRPWLPDRRKYVLHKLHYVLGYGMTTNPHGYFNRMIEWEDVTFRVRDRKYLSIMEQSHCVNAKCLNISKDYTDDTFEAVFKYPINIDPLRYAGRAIQKSKANSRHDGKVIFCPIEKREEEYIYQKVINNEFDEKYFYDIRVPIFEDKIPFVYYKYRLKDDRFDNYVLAEVIKNIDEVFTPQEIENILIFTKKIGLQYGELDVLRDKDDKKIYIVDANNTPFGPRIDKMSLKDFVFAIICLAKTFDEVFIQSYQNPLAVSLEDRKYIKTSYKGAENVRKN